jgi:putative heme-binding domain-containing protein
MQVLREKFINAGNLDTRIRIIAVGRVGGPTAMIYSDDLGKSWQQVDIRDKAAMAFDVHFFNRNEGIIATASSTDVAKSNAMIIATSDGGKTWTNAWQSTRPFELTWKIAFPTREALKPDASAKVDRLDVVERKVAAIERIDVDMQLGGKQFADRCAVCHKLGDQGKVIGPQLEGVGARGAQRLTEDILWPDRNVDEAFRLTILLLESGESVSGLVSDRSADSLMLTDQMGKQRRILLSEIDQEKPSKLSLMPGNFDELMTDLEFASLIGFLRGSVKVAQ